MTRTLTAIGGMLLIAGSSVPAGTGIVPDESIVAVITHKGGFASGLAHNHLVAATRYTARLELDENNPLETSFTFEVATEDLVVDRPEWQQAWQTRLQELGLIDESFVELPEGKRDKIRSSMLGRGQLDAENHPVISASVLRIGERNASDGDSFEYEVTLSLEVCGTRVERPVRARYEATDGAVVIEATGSFRFTDFGIKPFSAMLGAVKNQDEFDVYVHLMATDSQ